MNSLKLLLVTLCLTSALHADEALRQKALQHGLKPLVEQDDRTKSAEARIILGKKLFFEKNLSLNRDISCASCHATAHGGADGRSTAIGDRGQKNPSHLNTPTVLNTVFRNTIFGTGAVQRCKIRQKGLYRHRLRWRRPPL